MKIVNRFQMLMSVILMIPAMAAEALTTGDSLTREDGLEF